MKTGIVSSLDENECFDSFDFFIDIPRGKDTKSVLLAYNLLNEICVSAIVKTVSRAIYKTL